MKSAQRYLGVLLLASLGGCAQLPTDLPARLGLNRPETSATLAKLSAHAPSPAVKTAPIQPWWETYKLPELDALVQRALRDHPDIQAARARIDQATQTARLASLAADVHYGTDAGFARTHLSENGLFPSPIGGSTYNEITLTQTLGYNLDWWGQAKALIRAAGNERIAAEAESRAVQETIAAAVADSYFAWADVQTRLTLARELEQSHQQEHAILRSRYDIGLDAADALIASRKILDQDADRVHALEYLDRAWRFRLAALIGDSPDQSATLATPRLPDAVPALPDTVPLDWLSQRPDILALKSRIEAASDRSDASRAAFYPNIDLRAMIGLDTLDIGKLLKYGSISTSIGPAVHLPIFNGQTLRTQLHEREAEYDQAVAAYNRAVLDAARQSADAYSLISTLDRRASAQEKALAETEQLQALSASRQKLGLDAPQTVIAEQSAVIEEHMKSVEIQAARLRAQVSLYKALGMGFPAVTPSRSKT